MFSKPARASRGWVPTAATKGAWWFTPAPQILPRVTLTRGRGHADGCRVSLLAVRGAVVFSVTTEKPPEGIVWIREPQHDFGNMNPWILALSSSALERCLGVGCCCERLGRRLSTAAAFWLLEKRQKAAQGASLTPENSVINAVIKVFLLLLSGLGLQWRPRADFE